jgi:hypothetical protein
MDLFWQINPEEMLSGLMVTTFLILLDASVMVVCSMVMFPLIDLAFKKKAKPAPAQVAKAALKAARGVGLGRHGIARAAP